MPRLGKWDPVTFYVERKRWLPASASGPHTLQSPRAAPGGAPGAGGRDGRQGDFRRDSPHTAGRGDSAGRGAETLEPLPAPPSWVLYSPPWATWPVQVRRPPTLGWGYACGICARGFVTWGGCARAGSPKPGRAGQGENDRQQVAQRRTCPSPVSRSNLENVAQAP